MTGSKAYERALALSALSGVSDARAVYQYSRGGYAVLVTSAMNVGLVVLIDEEAVALWMHNHAYWQQNKERGDG